MTRRRGGHVSYNLSCPSQAKPGSTIDIHAYSDDDAVRYIELIISESFNYDHMEESRDRDFSVDVPSDARISIAYVRAVFKNHAGYTAGECQASFQVVT
jgi:hypothetical protein